MVQLSAYSVLLGMVSEKITFIKIKCRRNKLLFQLLTGSSIFLSASITFTLGFDFPEHASTQKNIALALGLLLTFTSGWMAVFDYKKLWMRQKLTLFSLYQIENELKFLSTAEQDKMKIENLFMTYQSIWNKDGDEWVSIYSSQPEEPK